MKIKSNALDTLIQKPCVILCENRMEARLGSFAVSDDAVRRGLDHDPAARDRITGRFRMAMDPLGLQVVIQVKTGVRDTHSLQIRLIEALSHYLSVPFGVQLQRDGDFAWN